MHFNKVVALFLISLITTIPLVIAVETDEKTFVFPRYSEQPAHNDIIAVSNECPPQCPVGYSDEGVDCVGSDCTRICSIMACSNAGSIVYNDYSNSQPEWNDDAYDFEDEGPGYTPQSGKCYEFNYIASTATDSSDSSECYDLYTDDDYENADYDMDCEGNDIDAYAGIGFVGTKTSSTWLRTIPGSTQNTDYGYIGKVDNSYWKYRYVTDYGRDAAPDNSGSDAGSWDHFNQDICDEAGSQALYCAPSYESCILWGKGRCGYGCAGETTKPFIVMGVYSGDNNDLGDALDDNWDCREIDNNNYYASSNNYQVTEYSLEKRYANTQAQCCISHNSNSCYDDDVYWYYSCGKQEDKKEECTQPCTSWGSNYCSGNNVYHQRTCYNTGCSGGSCYANSYNNEEKVADCAQGCAGGSCISCTPNDSYSCYDNDAYWYDSCGNLGAKKEECGSFSCGSWGSSYCKNNDVYHARTCDNQGCLSGHCYSNPYNDEQLQEDCPNECDAGKCTECSEGPCCDIASRRFRSSDNKCRYYQQEIGCTDSDNDVYHRYVDQYCSGSSSACSGQIVSASNWYVYKKCSRDEICYDGDCAQSCDETCKEWAEKEGIWKYRDCDNFKDDCSMDDVVAVKYYPDGFKHSKSEACVDDDDCCGGAGKCLDYDNIRVCVFDNGVDYGKCITPPNKKPGCDVPDGTAGCSCDSSFDCPYYRPYCQNEYGAPISDGYDACLISPPEHYCGDNECIDGEDAAGCPKDCSVGVGELLITVQKDGIPVGDVAIELDNTYSGKTGINGKLKIMIKYGTYKITACCASSCKSVSKTISSPNEYETFRGLSCPALDSDGDGWTDSQEKGIGTDPDDRSSNFGAYVKTHEPDKDWLNVAPLFSGVLTVAEKRQLAEHFEILSSQELQSPGLAEELLFNITANKTGPKLLAALENGQEMAISQNGGYALLLITDMQGQTSAFILPPAVSGFLRGLLSGAYGGIKDDVALPAALIKALWYIVINLNEIFYVWDYVRDAIKNVSSMIGEIDKIIVDNIISQGENYLEKNSIDCDANERVSFLYGFYYGYGLGYVVEQLVVFGYLAKAIKSFAAGEKFVATTEKATQALARITSRFGSSVAYSLKNLQIWKKAVQWGDDVQDGMATIVKYGTKGQVDEVVGLYGEDVAKIVYKSAGKNMAKTISKLPSDFSNKGFFIAKHQSVLNHLKNYGTDGRTFIAELNPQWIDKARLNDLQYVKEIEGKLGLPKGRISNGDEIMIIEIDNAKSRFIGDGIPKIEHVDPTLKVTMPNTGSTIGGIPERVISSQDLTGIYEIQKSTNIFTPR